LNKTDDLKQVTDIVEEKSSNTNGVKLTIQNKISKLDPDHDEKPRRIISEASSISTVTAEPKIKEHDFFSSIDNSTLRKILKNNRYSLEFLSNKLSNEDINSKVGEKI
jgi:CHAD domain-containing protein